MKAVNFIRQLKAEYVQIDIMKNPPSESYLKLALIQFEKDKTKLFNTRGKSFREISVNVEDLSNNEIMHLLKSDGKLVKRPFLIYENKNILLGFNESDYIKYIK